MNIWLDEGRGCQSRLSTLLSHWSHHGNPVCNIIKIIIYKVVQLPVVDSIVLLYNDVLQTIFYQQFTESRYFRQYVHKNLWRHVYGNY